MGHRKTLGLIIALSLIAAACGNGTGTLSETTATDAGSAAIGVTTGSGSAADPAEPTVPAADTPVASTAGYPIVDTGQVACYDAAGAVITCPTADEAFSGQDGNYEGNQSAYLDNGDGTVSDLVTGLMWQQDPGDKMSYEQAAVGADAFELAGYDDWRLPTIKELYSLILFTGTDPSACQSDTDVCGAIPFIDDVFDFAYGDTSDGERFIDSQWATSTIYSGLTMGGDETMFGVNFADGRIKGYGTSDPRTGEDKGFFVIYVRGNEAYGENEFVDGGDGTITDLATLLMWEQDDSGSGMDWESALEYCEVSGTGGYDDWRLPNVKGLQSIVDYERSPQATGSAAIDPMFGVTVIVDEGGGSDFGSYWSSTTHNSVRGGESASYVAFGEALGWMQSPQGDYTLMDVHGAGAQRSDPKTGDASDYPYGHGPQGDVIRIDNMVRCVRGGESGTTSGALAETAAPDLDIGAETPAEGGHLADAAAELGISEDALVAALGDPAQGPPDLEEAARILGISVEELRSVLPPPPDGG